MCSKPGYQNEGQNNFYNLNLGGLPEFINGFNNTKSPHIDDPLNPQNNVGKSSYLFEDIQKIFKVGYQSAFLGCFCDCHNQPKISKGQPESQDKNIYLKSQQFNSDQHFPVFQLGAGEQVATIVYQDEYGQRQVCSVD